jgi:hypothetical protein
LRGPGRPPGPRPAGHAVRPRGPAGASASQTKHGQEMTGQEIAG